MYNNIISIKNLYEGWSEFVCGKKTKKDVAGFSLNLSQNIFNLHQDLKNKTYRHGTYQAFNISDPKPRNIHKATVRDRLLHHAIYKILYPHFDKKFIHDSYSCRNLKGTHRAINRFSQFAQKVSHSNHRTCWILKCDIRKFFASIDHTTLIEVVKRHLSDFDTICLLQRVVESFSSNGRPQGLPLGNLTSQLLVNVYMNEFDQFMKHTIKAKYYIRYADDFVILSHDKKWIIKLIPVVKDYLESRLKLSLHPNKVIVKTWASGVDFLGWVHFPNHRVLRTSTKRRMLKKLNTDRKKAVIDSYLGLLRYGNTHKLKQKVKDLLYSIHHVQEL